MAIKDCIWRGPGPLPPEDGFFEIRPNFMIWGGSIVSKWPHPWSSKSIKLRTRAALRRHGNGISPLSVDVEVSTQRRDGVERAMLNIRSSDGSPVDHPVSVGHVNILIMLPQSEPESRKAIDCAAMSVAKMAATVAVSVNAWNRDAR